MTLMVSENLDAASYADPFAAGRPDSSMGGGMGSDLPYAVIESLQGFVWWGDVDAAGSVTPPYGAARLGRINSPSDSAANGNPYYPYTNARPSSRHPSGVNALFCDGHTRFLSQEIDYLVYCQLMSSDGPGVRPPGAMMAPNTTTWLLLRTAPVNDSQIQ
jgi:prepilin-type processing-associated H-X9-DG protein